MIRHVGTNVVEAIIRCRKEKGAYGDFYDFLRRVDAVACNKKTIESLIKAGAFDSMGHTRKGLLAVHADGIDSPSRCHRRPLAPAPPWRNAAGVHRPCPEYGHDLNDGTHAG